MPQDPRLVGSWALDRPPAWGPEPAGGEQREETHIPLATTRAIFPNVRNNWSPAACSPSLLTTRPHSLPLGRTQESWVPSPLNPLDPTPLRAQESWLSALTTRPNSLLRAGVRTPESWIPTSPSPALTTRPIATLVGWALHSPALQCCSPRVGLGCLLTVTPITG